MRKIKNSTILKVCILVFVVGLVVLNVSKTQAKSIEPVKVSYSQRSTYDKKGDGWIYVFEIYYPDNNNDRVYMFDGYNLKYKELDGYYVPVINKETNEELYRVTPEYITLSISENSKEDISKIVKFFNEKQFNNKITTDDLNELDIKTIDKSYLVSIFNSTLDADLKTEPGKYYNSGYVGRVNVKSSDVNNPGEWQASYILSFGNMYEVNIEFISEDGKYLSDKTSNLTSKEKKYLEQIELAEEIAEMNEFCDEKNDMITKKTANIGNNDITELLNKLSDELMNK